jgi:hypothetical protein
VRLKTESRMGREEAEEVAWKRKQQSVVDTQTFSSSTCQFGDDHDSDEPLTGSPAVRWRKRRRYRSENCGKNGRQRQYGWKIDDGKRRRRGDGDWHVHRKGVVANEGKAGKEKGGGECGLRRKRRPLLSEGRQAAPSLSSIPHEAL